MDEAALTAAFERQERLEENLAKEQRFIQYFTAATKGSGIVDLDVSGKKLSTRRSVLTYVAIDSHDHARFCMAMFVKGALTGSDTPFGRCVSAACNRSRALNRNKYLIYILY